MSYHNGSVWPHDNAMIVAGLDRYGLKSEAASVTQALLDAAEYQPHRRLPELFCGFLRRRRRGPVNYPVACSPQAWAAAAPFALLSACLGLRISAKDAEVRLYNPVMPSRIHGVTLSNVHLGLQKVDLRIERHGTGAAVSVLRKQGDVSVLVNS